MTYQLDIFIHQVENNPSSQNHLDENRQKFSDKCRTVYNWLLEGRELTVLWAANNGVASLPRRIKDLRESGVEISDRWEKGVKVYYIEQKQIA